MSHGERMLPSSPHWYAKDAYWSISDKIELTRLFLKSEFYGKN